MPSVSPPNLFTYATSELSQDAWICWLVAHVDCDERPALRDAARDFVARLWNRARPGEPVAAEDVGDLRPGDPEPQARHIDVLFEVRVRDKRVAFVIEDKTDTSHHSDQLTRYAAEARRLRPGAEPVLVYLKTGYHFERDAAVHATGYGAFGLEDLVDFFSAHTITSDIFNDFARHHADALAERRRCIAALNAGTPDFRLDFVQHAFLTRLRDACGSTNALSRGTNRDGSPWTHWSFASTENVGGAGATEYLFHRVDKRMHDGRPSYYLSTRQYLDLKRAPEARPAKLARLRAYQAAFNDAVAATRTPLRMGQVSGDKRGANESEIGVLFFDDTQTTNVVLEQYPAIHRAFVERLHADRGGAS